MIKQLERYLLEPVNTLTHLFGAICAVVLTVEMMVVSRPGLAPRPILLIYGLCWILLYTSSALFHGLKVQHKWHFWLNRLDHIAIFLVIAGTYTPIIYVLLPAPGRGISLALIWSVALVGSGFKLFSKRIHGFLNASIYMLMGWLGAVSIFFVEEGVLNPAGITLLLIGGLLYSIGFVIYYKKRPNPWPGLLAHHEIWHLLILTASYTHHTVIINCQLLLTNC